MPSSTKAIATRTLPSGDTAIVFERSNDEGWFRKDDTWARRALGIDLTNPTPLAASGPKLVIRNINAKVLAGDLTEVREELASTANITITELRPLYSRERMAETGCLRVTVATSDDAKRLLYQGALVNYEMHRVAKWKEDTRIPLCHNCQAYGHKAYTCKAQTRCALCGKGHASADCKTNEDERRCPSCKGRHPAYSRDCVFGMSAEEKERQEKKQREAERREVDEQLSLEGQRLQRESDTDITLQTPLHPTTRKRSRAQSTSVQ